MRPVINYKSVRILLVHMMDITQIYAMAIGGFFGLLLALRTITSLVRILQPYMLLVKHFFYPLVLRRHRFFGPWTRAQVFCHLFYLTINLFCSTYQVSTVQEAGDRAGVLSLINIMPTCLGWHLSFISDILGLSLLAYRHIHASTGAMSVFLGLFHVGINMANIKNLSLFSASGQLFGFIVKTLSWK
jgi:hypothetical protein